MSLSATALVTLIEAKEYLRMDAAEDLQIFAEYVGEGDGLDTTFSLDNTPIDGSLRLYVNNVLQTETTHYSISGANITFVTAPTNLHPITASYDKGASSDTFEEYVDEELEALIEAATKIAEDRSDRAFIQRSVTESHLGDGGEYLSLYKEPVESITSVVREVSEIVGTGDGSTVDFDLDETPTSLSVKVYVDGSLQTLTTDYTISGATITFVSAPSDGAVITATYTHTILWISEYTAQLSKGRLYGTWAKNTIYEVVYTAGEASTRAATQALVPDAVLAVLLIIADLYDNRGDTVDSINISGVGSTSYKLPSRADKILNSLRPRGGFI